MNDEATKPVPVDKEPYRMRLPGFVSDADIGLGDAVKRVIRAFGVMPCGGCDSRAAARTDGWSFPARR